MASVPTPGPGSIVIANNMREARQNGMSRNMATAYTYYWFCQKVRNGGPWDYKKFDPYFAAFGNFNFGSAGTSKAKWGKWYDKPPYGDDPTDQRNIREGIDYAIQNGY